MALLHRLIASPWLIHLAILASAAAWLKLGAPLGPSWAEALAATPAQIVAAPSLLAAALAVLYGSSNLALQALLLGAIFTGLNQAPAPHLTIAAVTILLPVNVLALTILDDRGLLSPAGLLRLAILLAQGLGAAFLAHFQPSLLATIEATSLLPPPLSAWSSLPDQGLVLASLALAALLLRALLQPDPAWIGAAAALLAALAGLELAAHNGVDTPRAAIPFLLAILLLLTTVLQQAHQLAFRDGLTGLPNRRAMDAMLQDLGGQFAVAMIDVDHFKDFNDTYGHEIGDQVLRRVAASILRVGSGGRPFRYGGEEFAILFPGRNPEQIAEILEDLRKAIGGTPFQIRNGGRPSDNSKGTAQRGQGGASQEVPITISIGLAGPSGPADTPEAVIQAADEALYRAKQRGRNCLAQ